MSCSDNAAEAVELINSIKNGFATLADGIGTAVGPASVVAKKLAAKMRGTEDDTSIGDVVNSVIGTPLEMAKGQAIGNMLGDAAGTTYEFYDAGSDLYEVHQNVKQAQQGYKTAADEHGKAARGQCEPDGSGGSGGGGSGGGNSGGASGAGGRVATGGSGKPPGYDTRPIDPLVLDLNGGGIDLVSRSQSSAYFDMNSDGFAERVGWIAQGSALLALDANNNGAIDNITELFGNATTDGFDALRVLDSNNDGVISSADERFSELRIWSDANGNGTTETGELQSLASAGIASINLNASGSPYNMAGNIVARSSTFTRQDGSTSTASSIWFDLDRTDTRYIPPANFEYTVDAGLLPRLRGYGQVADLSIAITLDQGLAASLKQLVVDSNTLDAASFRARVETFVLDWFDVNGAPDGTRGSHVNYAHLQATEKWFGTPFWQQDISSQNATFISSTFDQVVDLISAKLLTQIGYSAWALQAYSSSESVPLLGHSLSSFMVWDYDPETDTLDGRMDYFLALALDQVPSEAGAAAQQLSKLKGYLSLIADAVYQGNWSRFSVDLNDAIGFVNETTLADDVIRHSLFHDVEGGSNDNDILQGQSAGAALLGGDGDDQITGLTGQEMLVGGKGNDSLAGGDGSDVYFFDRGDGQDTISESISNHNYSDYDVIQLRVGIRPEDIQLSRQGDNLIITIVGTSDQLTVAGQFHNHAGFTAYDIEELRFADGTVWSKAAIQERLLTGTSGNDHLTGFHTGDLLDGGAGNDVLAGADGGDTYVFGRGYGQDVIRESLDDANYSDYDVLRFNADVLPEDVVLSRQGNNLTATIRGTSEFITIEGQFSQTAWYTWWDVEEFRFANGTVWSKNLIQEMLIGGTAGDDNLVGYITDDRLNGLAGNDRLAGGDGNDTYVFGRGWGQDVIAESLSYALNGEYDVVEFAEGVAPSDLTLSRSGDTLTVKIAGTTDTLTISGQFIASGWYDIDAFRFADGTVWSRLDIQAMLIPGTPGNDVLVGFVTGDRLDGKAGNDRLEGRDGSDTYVFGRGYGQDTVVETIDNHNYDDADAIELGSGITPDDIILSRQGDSLTISIRDTTDSITVVGEFYNSAWYSPGDIETLRFADGTVWTKEQIQQKLLASTPGDDTLIGFYTSDVFDGGAGNDVMHGDEGSDTYFFGRGYGDDTVYETVGHVMIRDDEVLRFKSDLAPSDITLKRIGDDLVIGIKDAPDTITIKGGVGSSTYTDVETFVFADGTTWSLSDVKAMLLGATMGDDVLGGFSTADHLDGLAGNDKLYGYGGTDTLIGGTGNDRVEGGEHNDVYIYRLGDGDDSIYDYHYHWGSYDVLKLGEGISPGDVLLTANPADGGDIMLSFSHAAGSILLDNQLNGGQHAGIDQIQFADGTSWSQLQIANKFLEGRATSGNDVIGAGWLGETVLGADGNDALYGYGGADTLIGGTGNDRMEGGEHNDVYIYNLGDGDDSVYDYIYYYGSFDVLKLGTGITPGDVILSRVATDGGDIMLSFSHTAGSILLDNQLNGLQHAGIDQILFADGTAWSQLQIANKVLEGQVTSGNDVIGAGWLGETVQGGGGDDALYGYGGADTLIGGTGNDRIEGGEHNDTYVYSRGDGNDSIYDYHYYYGSFDRLVLNGINPGDITAWRSAADLNDTIIALNDGSGTILLDQQYVTRDSAVEQIQFADGTVWSSAQLAQYAATIRGDAANNTINATGGHDIVEGLAGNDTINAGAGNDRLVGGQGDDTLNGSDGTDTAELSGRWYDYGIVRQANGSFVLSDRTGSDGTDTLTGIETVKFADRSFAPDALLDGWAGGKAVVIEDATPGTTAGTVIPAAAAAFANRMTFSLLDDAGGRFVIDSSSGVVSVADGASFVDVPPNLGIRVGVDYANETSRTFELSVTVDRIPTDLQLQPVSSRPSMTLNGYAWIAGDGDYGLTPNRTNRTGAIWGEVDLSMDVTWTTNMYFGGKYATGGEGIAFGLQNVSRNVLSGFGGVLPNNSFGIKFDTYTNGNLGEPGANFSQFIRNGVQGPASLAFDSYKVTGTLETGTWRGVVIKWNAATKTLSYSIDGVLVGSKVHDVVATDFAGDNTAFFGFGGFTSLYYTEQRVQILSVETAATKAASIVENAGAGTLVGKLVGTDPDTGDKLTYTIVDQAGSSVIDPTFEIVNGNELRVKAGAIIDFETQSGYRVYAKVTDAAGASIVRAFDISVIDAVGSTTAGTAGNDVLTGMAEADVFSGLDGADTLHGKGGDDQLTGGLGNDALDGGTGTDTAVFAGLRADYAIVTTAGAIQVVDNNLADGDDGTDTLTAIEHVQFSDETVSLAAPIVLDLDGDGIELKDLAKSNARFDFDGDGLRDKTGWIGKGDGLLVLDRNGDGRINDASELSFVDDRQGAKSDLDGLRSFDSNGDSLLSAADDMFAQFKVWQDRDRDGVVDKRELVTLDKAGVVSLDLGGRATEQTWDWGSNIVVNEGRFTRSDGTSSAFADVALIYNGSRSADGSASELDWSISDQLSRSAYLDLVNIA